MKKLLGALAAVLSMSAQASTVLIEDFEANFPAWESGWLGTNSNLRSHYGVNAGRGNNPDGLWISDGIYGDNGSVINFNNGFGADITKFSIDVTTWVQVKFEAFDMNGNLLVSTPITSYFGAYTNPGHYQTISFDSLNGVSRFQIIGGGVEGNTSIDNVMVTKGANAVPEPMSLALVGLGLAGVAVSRRKKR